MEKEVINLSQYIQFTDYKVVRSGNTYNKQASQAQLEVFSPHIADLLIRCCIEIEAISKELYYDNGGTKIRGSNDIYFDTDCIALINEKWNTNNKVVLVVAPFCDFLYESNKILKPLKNAHKKQGTSWEKAYQAVKHDRYNSISKGTIKQLLNALASLYLLNLYMRNDRFVSKYTGVTSMDFSFGSKIYAVKPPVSEQPWYNNNPIDSDSPFVITYKQDEFEKIVEIQNKESEAINNYWNNQPELIDPKFIQQLNNSIASEKVNSPFVYFLELSRYRLNKKIPSHISFKEKKELLLESEEWKCNTNRRNNKFAPNDINEENFQNIINDVATMAGMDLMLKYQKLEWVSLAMNKAICEIYIP